MKRKNLKVLLIVLILALFSINYNFLNSEVEKFLNSEDTFHVERIIDGDTIVLKENETRVRLLGINTPERGEKYYEEAKVFLENKILNKTVSLEYGRDKTDLYGRTLSYVYFNSENINKKLVENGLANFYFPQGKDVHYDDFKDSWISCLNENKNLCEKSTNKCSSCIILEKFDHKSEETTFLNQCDFECNLDSWEIKDEGRKKFRFPKFSLKPHSKVSVIVGKGTDDKSTLFWNRESYVWTNTGDTLFLRDSEGKLVLWNNY